VYIATVTQKDKLLEVALGGADFILHHVYGGSYGDHFNGWIEPNGQIEFWIGWGYYRPRGSYDIVERYADTALVVEGVAGTSGSAQHLSATLNGTVRLAGATVPP
jgi:hypothetical protein